MWRRSIETLSVEVLGRVLDELNEEDLLSASFVCRHWFDVINVHLLQRKRAAILRPEASDFIPNWPLQSVSLVGFSSQQCRIVKHACHHLNKLYIGYQGNRDRYLDETAVADLFNSCQNLREIAFKNVVPSDSLLRVIVECGFNTLQSLSFQCSTSVTNSKRVQEILERVHFPETRLAVRQLSRNKQLMVIKYPPVFNVPVIPTNAQIQTSVAALQIDCSGLPKDAYRCLSVCKHLRTIRLFNAFQLEDEAAILLTQLPALSKLSLSDANKVTAIGWTAVFQCANITHVSLSRCTAGLSNTVFEHCTAASRYLSLDLQNCKRVTGDGLVLAMRLPQSVNLWLDYSEQLVNHLGQCVTLGFFSQLQSLNVKIQRVRATSTNVSTHLTNIKNNISSYANKRGVHFNYRELFTTNCTLHSTPSPNLHS